MAKVIYVSTPEHSLWRYLNPLSIFKDLLQYRELISSITIQNFRATYQASYLGVAWQVILPLIMLALFYYVFGVILGGRFSQTANESSLDFALALFVGLAFFNFIAQNIGTATSLILANQVYVKSLSFPLEIISVTSVLNSLMTLIITVLLSIIIMLLIKHHVYFSAIYILFYIICIFMIALGISWGLSAMSVFLRDISAIVSPITVILMFMCPIFYPASMVPVKLKWVIKINPIAVIIENARGCLLYGTWPTFSSLGYIFLVSILVVIGGYNLFMRSKNIFADIV